MAEKGSRYLSQLDAARCNGKWDEVPELARKVEKHISSRRCLVTVARAEAKIATQPVANADSTTKSTSAQSEKVEKSLQPLIKELEAAIQFEKHNVEDKFQAQTCLAWLYWNNSDYRNARDAVPRNIPASSEGKKLNDWTIVCIIKAAFFRSSSEEGLANLKDVPSTYEACLNSLQSLPAPALGIVEFCFWWERFFSRCCGCFYGVFLEKLKAKRRNIDTRACLQAFRAWSLNWHHLAGTASGTSESAKQKRNQRLLIWKSYYHVLSTILQHGYPYPLPGNNSFLAGSNSYETHTQRQSLLLELQKVEALYQSILLRQVSFPKASERNTEVVEWVDSLMINWNILCGPDWQEDDLNQGGKAVVTRKTLDSMYQAATLTFHSSTVLRHLFTLHAALAEFVLAEKALDTYLEVITKGKARVEKSGVPEPDLDSDETMLETIVSGIEMLCEFGHRTQIVKTIVLSNRLLNWLDHHGDNAQKDEKSSTATGEKKVSSHVYASVYKAIAISKASWARLSYETKERTKLQADAIKYLKLALQSDHTTEDDPSFLYPLALVLAETRNIEAAVAAIKQALIGAPKTMDSVDRKSLNHNLKDKTRAASTMVECWHLLALLLSSRQEFDTATIATRTALEQYSNSNERLIMSSAYERKLPFFQKRQIIEVKMTQISLTEINEGSQDAINLTAELLALYARLFELSKPPKTARTSNVPMTATGTVKSFRGSVFGRYRKSLRNSMVSLPQPDKGHKEPTPPTIAITADDTNTSRPTSQLPLRNLSHKLQKNRSRQSIRRSHSASPARTETRASMATDSVVSEIHPGATSQLRPASAWSNDPSEVGLAVSHDYPTVQTAQAVSMQHAQALRLDGNTESRPSKPAETMDISSEIPTNQDSSYRTPLSTLPAHEEERYAITLLNQIWLFVSSLYRRANNVEDARQAMDEAFKQAKLVEASKADPGPSSARAFDEAGWGGMKSVEEIWADSYAEMGHLCMVQGDPYEAMVKYEGALTHYPDHLDATVSLAHILLDVHAKKIPLSQKQSTIVDRPKSESRDDDDSAQPVFSIPARQITDSNQVNGSSSVDHDHVQIENGIEEDDQGSSYDLDLLAARDRAYTMLYNLTKLGSGWDNSDAWFALGDAYAASGQLEKAKEVLWWVVELEEKKPIRHWSCLGQGYKLQR